LQLVLQDALKNESKPISAQALSVKIKEKDQAETIFKLLNYLSANAGSKVKCVKRSGVASTFSIEG